MLFCGLRRGELRGLRWTNVDFDGGVIRVERSWDPVRQYGLTVRPARGVERAGSPTASVG